MGVGVGDERSEESKLNLLCADADEVVVEFVFVFAFVLVVRGDFICLRCCGDSKL